MIKRIYMKNIRNVEGELWEDLTGLDIYNGELGSGKSTRLDSIYLTILGYIPNMGKDCATSFLNSNSNTEMAVGIVKDCISYIRTFEKSEDNRISQKISIGADEHKLSEGNELISKEFGEDIFVFNLKEFLDLSDDKKKEFIFNLGTKGMGEKDIYREFVDKYCRRITNEGEVDGLLKFKYQVKSFSDLTKEQTKEATTILFNTLDDEKKMICNETLAKFVKIYLKCAHDTQGLLNEALAYFSNDKKIQMRIKRDAEAANREYQRMKTMLDVDSSLVEIEKEVKQTQDSITEVKIKIANNDKNKEIIEHHQQQTSRIMKILATLAEDNIKEWREELTNVDKNIEDITDKKEKLELSIDDYKKIETEIESYQIAIKKAKNVSKNKVCVISDQLPCTTDLKPALENLADLIEERNRELDKIESNINDIKDSLKENYPNIKFPLKPYLNEISKWRNELNEKISMHTKQVELYTQEKKDLDKINLSTFNVVDDMVYQKQLDGLLQHQAVLNDKQKETQALKEKMISIQSASLSKLMAQQRVDFDKKAIDSIKEIINDMLSQSIEPIKEIVNKLLSGIKKDFVFDMYLDEKDHLLFGWQREKGFSPFNSLSGGETILFSIALIAALIIKREPKLKILCIKAAEVSILYFKLMLAGLKAMKSNLDNILVEYPHELPENIEGWNIIRL